MFYCTNFIEVLDFLITNLDLTVDHEGREAGDEVGALALITIHERVLGALLSEVILLLGAPRARVRSVHGHAWTAWGLVLLWRHKLSLTSHAGVWHVAALGAEPPLVHVKGENADDHSECDTHNNRITIHLLYARKKEFGTVARSRERRSFDPQDE